jgi:hypothetical protein
VVAGGAPFTNPIIIPSLSSWVDTDGKLRDTWPRGAGNIYVIASVYESARFAHLTHAKKDGQYMNGKYKQTSVPVCMRQKFMIGQIIIQQQLNCHLEYFVCYPPHYIALHSFSHYVRFTVCV